MSSTFHLAIPVTSIKEAEKFYCGLLGCKKGNYEEGKWQDINFWGNELTLHEADHALSNERHQVDMGQVCVPHFGKSWLIEMVFEISLIPRFANGLSDLNSL